MSYSQWMNKAACTGISLELFFPKQLHAEAYRRGLAFCNVCPVLQECLQYAIDTNSMYGVFGGTMPSQRHTTPGHDIQPTLF